MKCITSHELITVTHWGKSGHGGTQMPGESRLWSAGVRMHFAPLERRLWPRCSHVNFEWPPQHTPSHSSQAPRLPLHDIIAEACPPSPCESPRPYSHWASASHTFLSLPLLFPSFSFSSSSASTNPLPFSLPRRRHCLGRGPDQKTRPAQTAAFL